MATGPSLPEPHMANELLFDSIVVLLTVRRTGAPIIESNGKFRLVRIFKAMEGLR